MHKNTQKVLLGYCPTMTAQAKIIAEENNYGLIKFDSASEVLSAMYNRKIDKGLIGRKAEKNEINENIKEEIIESGYTLVSNQKKFLNISELKNTEVRTYLSKEITDSIIPSESKIVYYGSKKETISKILGENIVLIPWEDWMDEFSLVVVLDGNLKAQ